MSDRRPSISNTRRDKLFELHGKLCHICNESIDPVHERWEVEHVIPRAILGRSADTDDNMRPAHVHCHAVKTRQDRTDIAKTQRIHLKHTGAYRPRHPMNYARKRKAPKRCASERARMRPEDTANV